MALTAAELEIIKSHLSKENAEKATADNGVTLLADQMKALSLLAIDQADQLKKAEALSLSKIEVDPDTLETSVELVETKLSALVTEGAITPAVQKNLAAVLVGAEGSRNVMALSRKATGGAKPLATLIIDALKGNKAVKIGEKTSAQQKIELSRTDDQDKEIKSFSDAMLAGANRGAK